MVPSAPLWREKAAALSVLPGDKTHALAFPRDAEEAALSPLSPCGRGAGGEGASARETGAQLLQRILAERRARWEAKQLAKFAELRQDPVQGLAKKIPGAGATGYQRFAGIAGGVGVELDWTMFSCCCGCYAKP